MPDKYFELAVVDPPYGIGMDGGQIWTSHYQKKDWDKRPPRNYFCELMRVAKNQIIFGANHLADLLPNPASSCWLVWDKQNGANGFADCELAWTSFPSAVRIYRYRWLGMWQGDKVCKSPRIHPTQKPVDLYAWILKNYAKPGDKILDTHLGSGSSRIAAYDLGFDFVGFELDKDYFDAQEARFAAHTAQQSLFI